MACWLLICCLRLLSEVSEKPDNSWTGCDDDNFVEIIFTDLVAAKALPPSVLQAYRYVTNRIKIVFITFTNQ